MVSLISYPTFRNALSRLRAVCVQHQIRIRRRKMSNYAFLFPGQGSQTVGMTSKIANPPAPAVGEIFQTAERVLGYDLRSLCLEGPQDVLDQTVHCQPAVVVASLAALEDLKNVHPQVYSSCKAAAGFSVGEFTALIFAGAFSLEQGLSLIKLRAESMHDACTEQPSGMLTVVGLEEQTVNRLCLECKERLPRGAEEICIANYLFPKGYVVSGTREALKLMRELVSGLKDVQCTVKEVRVSGAFHSNLLNSAVAKLRKGLEKAEISAPRIPVYSNVTGLPYSGIEEIRQRLAEQVIKPVLWEATIRNMIERGREKEEEKEGGGERDGEGEEEGREVQFVEVGPGRQLRSMLKRINSDAFKKCINFG